MSNNVLSFIPEEKLESDTAYTITLHLDKLYSDVEKDLEDFKVNVQTLKTDFSVTLGDSPSIYDKDWYYVEGVLNASDVIESEKIAEVLKASYDGKDHNVKFDVSDKYTIEYNLKLTVYHEDNKIKPWK